jgi:hypothetical protein
MRFLKTEFKNTDENILKELNSILEEKEKFNAFNLVVGSLITMNFYYICN